MTLDFLNWVIYFLIATFYNLNLFSILREFYTVYNVFDHVEPCSPSIFFKTQPQYLPPTLNTHLCIFHDLLSRVDTAHMRVGIRSSTGAWSTSQGLYPGRKLIPFYPQPSIDNSFSLNVGSHELFIHTCWIIDWLDPRQISCNHGCCDHMSTMVFSRPKTLFHNNHASSSFLWGWNTPSSWKTT